MKKHVYQKLVLTSLVLTIMGCAANGGGNNMLGTVDSGLASVEQTAQTGRQAIATGANAAEAGTAAVSDIATGEFGLTNILAQQLGITQHQAMGGAGAIFQAAQASMDPQAFSTLAQSIPGMNEMLNAAPVLTNPMGEMGSGVSALLGDAGGTINNAATLASSFQQLNLSPDMVGQFVPIVTDYVRNTSGQITANMLNSALSLP